MIYNFYVRGQWLENHSSKLPHFAQILTKSCEVFYRNIGFADRYTCFEMDLNVVRKFCLKMIHLICRKAKFQVYLKALKRQTKKEQNEN